MQNGLFHTVILQFIILLDWTIPSVLSVTASRDGALCNIS